MKTQELKNLLGKVSGAKLFYSAVLVLVLIPQSLPAQASGGGDGLAVMSYAQRVPMQKWLKANGFYRLATEARDCSNSEGLSRTREYWGALYYPYYKAGEFNLDGNDDFAVALIDTRKTKDNFDVAIFHGDGRGGYSPKPFYISRGHDLASGGLFYNGFGRGGRLFAGSFESDDGTVFDFRRNRYTENGMVP